MNEKRYYLIEHKDVSHQLMVLDSKTLLVGYPYVLNHDETDKINQFLQQIANGENIAKVPGYSIFFTVKFCMIKERYPDDLIKTILNNMAQFYLEYRVQEKPGKYYKSRDDYYPGCLSEKSTWTREQIEEKQKRKRIKRGEL